MSRASYAEILTLPPAKRGNTYSGYEIPMTVNGEALDLTGAVVVLTLAYGHGSLTTVDSGGLTITDATGGKITVDKQVINFAALKHKFNIKYTLSGGDIKTYIDDGEWEIT